MRQLHRSLYKKWERTILDSVRKRRHYYREHYESGDKEEVSGDRRDRENRMEGDVEEEWNGNVNGVTCN